MQEKLNVRQVLRVFNAIREHGEKRGSKYYLDGIVASTSYDEYTLTLSNEYVTLEVFFHNKFALQCSSRRQRVLFLDKLGVIDKAYSGNSKRLP